LGSEYDLAFANGGYQTNKTIPEKSICEDLGINLIDGLGNKYNQAVNY
jgi:hypothetical protein